MMNIQFKQEIDGKKGDWQPDEETKDYWISLIKNVFKETNVREFDGVVIELVNKNEESPDINIYDIHSKQENKRLTQALWHGLQNQP